MKIEEINKVLEITGRVSNIYMPNEIFSDLQSYVVEGVYGNLKVSHYST